MSSRILSSCYRNKSTEKKVIPNFPQPAQVSLLNFRPVAPTACWISISIWMLHGHVRLNISSLSSLSTFTSTPALPPPGVYILENGSTVHPVIQVRNLSIVLNSVLFLSLKSNPPSSPFILPA